jgi:hypothetical protein
MTVEELRRVHQATPFMPFTIYLADGRSHEVRHREFLSHSPSGRIVIVHHPDDSWDVVDLLLVTDLKGHPPTVAKAEGS